MVYDPVDDRCRRSWTRNVVFGNFGQEKQTLDETAGGVTGAAFNIQSCGGVVFGGCWKRLEVLGTLLELPSKLGGGLGEAGLSRLSV